MTSVQPAPIRTAPATIPRASRAARLLLALGIILIAANLRPALAATATVLDPIAEDVGLSTAATGALTTLPVLLFGLAGPGAPLLLRRFGVERTLALALVGIAVAAMLWLEGSVVTLFGGTLVFGAAAAVGNVLLPVIVRRDFPTRVGLMSGLYRRFANERGVMMGSS
jgi:CP family cyanate transporter-like MFS transporter